MAVLKGVSNFLKHADRDPTDEVSFHEEENDHLIFFATLECGELGEKLSYTMQAFQIWYLACHEGHLSGTEPGQKATAAMPGLHGLSRQARLERGSTFVAQVRAQYGDTA